MNPRAIFIDLCGTIFVYGDMQTAWHDWLVAYHTALGDCGLQMSRDEFSQRCEGFFSRRDAPVENDGLTLYERNIRQFGRELGLELAPEKLRPIADASVFAWFAHHRLDPEAVEVLQELSDRSPLVLVSNFDHPPAVHRILEQFDLTRYFCRIVISADVGVRKPDPAIFDEAFRELGVSPHEVMHIGDSEDDVNAALAAGIKPILIRRDGPDSAIVATDFNCDAQSYREPDLPAGGVLTIACLSEIVAHAVQA